jgi:hypothetical protein
LNLPAGMSFITGQVLLAMGTFEFQFFHIDSYLLLQARLFQGFFYSGHFVFQPIDLVANGFGDTMFDLVNQVY